MAYLDTPDTITGTLTLEGRNLLARAKLGDVVYRNLGWQVGRGGYVHSNPVKITPFIDPAVEAEGYFEILDNTNWGVGTKVILNGTDFIYGTHFSEGVTAAVTVTNIKNAILDSLELTHYRQVIPIIDPMYPERLYIKSLVTGEVGNNFPISVYNVGTVNLGVMPLTGGISTYLEDPAWPTPASLAPYSGDTGIIEIPSSTTPSLMSRLGEGIDGMGAYGELGFWVEVIDTQFPLELGRKVLYAMAHFPIQPKTDRTILTFRVVMSF
jgi:hypothetical protein